MEGKRIAIFDLDGTIIYTDEANSMAYRRALNIVGINNAVGICGRITADVIHEVGLDNVDVDAVIKVKIEAYCRELWRTRLGPATTALQCVLLNRSAFDKVVLLTDSAERRAMETLGYYGLEHYFDEIVCNCGQGGHGNKYDNYFKAFDSDPAACVVWENEEGQVMSAIAAGVKLENIRKVG